MDRTRYDALAPLGEYLSDVAVLAQAWKKSHSYIRRHNWYADTLELDCSAIELTAHLDAWAVEISGGHYQTAPLRLVLAPKNANWSFSPEWTITNESEGQLRPLAHLGIREQTIATAIMLCLADMIETAQGNTECDPMSAGRAGVHSYGNRLYCRWIRGQTGRDVARFSWGNSDTYSRYFRDYQRFIERPKTIAQNIAQSMTVFSPNRSLFILKLDVSAFYDNVDIDRLIRHLKSEWSDHHKNPGISRDDPAFWEAAKQALSFNWHERDVHLKHLLKGESLPIGLPQGMVSSGFFANAYLLSFDRLLGSLSLNASHAQGECAFIIHDYCRYVDDLRLVISACSSEVTEKQLAAAVTDFVQAVLDRALADASIALRMNPQKTEIEPLSDVGGESGTAARMKLLQQQLSGPFDMGMLHHAEAGLDGLLAQAELRRHAKPESSEVGHALAMIARSKLEVRDDTLTRFAAYRWVRALRLRRRMTGVSVRGRESRPAVVLRHDFEMVARRLVAAWAINPALVQVLRYAMDLFPSPDLLKPVISALRGHIVKPLTEYQRYVALYVSAELLRAGAIETGLRTLRDADFVIGDVTQYRVELQTFASELLGLNVPWYVLQQASLFLATRDVPVFPASDFPELVRYRALQEFISGHLSAGLDTADLISVSLVGYQFQRDPSRYLAWFRRFAKRDSGEVAAALEIVGNTYPELLKTLLEPRSIRAVAGALSPYLNAYTRKSRQANDAPLANGRWLRFSTVVMHRSRYFDQENALLKLCYGLAVLLAETKLPPEALTPWSLDLWCDTWERANDPSAEPILVKARRRPLVVDRRYATPSWCTEQDAWMYAIGRLLRAAATGEPDFTVRHWLAREEVGWYSGLRSTWQQRRVGMLQTHSALRGTQAGITPWFTELLMKLLRWPGTFMEEPQIVGSIDFNSPAELQRIIDYRIRAQAQLFGASSKLPVYVYPVQWPIRPSRNLTVAVLQGLMPLTSDFEEGGLDGLSKPGYREKHRDHVATLLNLAHKKIAAREAASGRSTKPKVDLVVLPEYSIHIDDQDLVRAFSDATGAIMFYGLIGAKDPVTGANINAARWLVPQRRGDRRSWIEIDQGKQHPTEAERGMGVKSWRPYQVVIELRSEMEEGYRLSGAVCYDATDLALAADLKNVSHMFVITAMNRDVKTFDSMVGALRFHMYQHIIIANSGEHGGSTAQAPYDREYKRLVTHSHGSSQLSIAIFDVNVDHFGPQLVALSTDDREMMGKTPPADLRRAKSV